LVVAAVEVVLLLVVEVVIQFLVLPPYQPLLQLAVVAALAVLVGLKEPLFLQDQALQVVRVEAADLLRMERLQQVLVIIIIRPASRKVSQVVLVLVLQVAEVAVVAVVQDK
jgi:hypothetical protein